MRNHRGRTDSGAPSLVVLVSVLLVLATPSKVFAQELRPGTQERPVEVKAVFGLSTFVDGAVANEDVATHGVIGASVRLGLDGPLSVRPQFLYTNEIHRRSLAAARSDHQNFYAVGQLIYDMKARGKVTPYWVFGGGVFQHVLTFDERPGEQFTSLEFHLGVGAGARIQLSDHWVLETEALIGGNPFLQFQSGVGYAF